MMESKLVEMIDKCNSCQIKKIIKLDYIDYDHYGILSDKESIKSYIECFADTKEMNQIYNICKEI